MKTSTIILAATSLAGSSLASTCTVGKTYCWDSLQHLHMTGNVTVKTIHSHWKPPGSTKHADEVLMPVPLPPNGTLADLYPNTYLWECYKGEAGAHHVRVHRHCLHKCGSGKCDPSDYEKILMQLSAPPPAEEEVRKRKAEIDASFKKIEEEGAAQRAADAAKLKAQLKTLLRLCGKITGFEGPCRILRNAF